MTWLLTIGLANAVLATFLAVIAFAVARWSKWPALAHLCWIIVLFKLLAPPVIQIPLGWQFDSQAVLAETTVIESGLSEACETSIISANNLTTTVCEQPIGRSKSTSIASGVKTSRISGRSIDRSSWISLSLPRVSWTTLARVAGLVWIVGSISFVLLFIYRWWQFNRLIAAAARLDKNLTARVRELAEEAGLKSHPTVMTANANFSPMLWGIGHRATLIFPMGLSDRLECRALDSLLLHELAHYARGDHSVRILELVATILYWWHPLVWWARHEIEEAEEQCCDAWVVEHQAGTRRSYAEAILATLDFISEPCKTLPPIASGLGRVSLLRRRLTQIIRGEVAAKLSPTAKILFVAWSVVIMPLGPALFASSARASKEVAKLGETIPNQQKPLVGTLRSVRSGVAMDAEELPADATPVSLMAMVDQLVPQNERHILWATADSPDGQYRIEARTGYKTSLIYPAKDWKIDLSYPRIDCVSFSPDSKQFVTGHPDRLFRIWDSRTGGVMKTVRVGDSITSVHFAPNGKQIAIGMTDGSVAIYDLAKESIVNQFVPGQAEVSCLRWSGDSQRLAILLGAWGDDGNANLVIWSARDGLDLQHKLQRPAGAVQWSGKDRLLVAHYNGTVDCRDLSDGSISNTSEIGKDRISAANWSGNIPLLMPIVEEEQLAMGR